MTHSKSNFIAISACFGFFGVVLGAFGAHGLKNILSPDLMTVYHTGVLYHLIHTIALLGFGIIHRHYAGVQWPGWCFSAGIIVFSGSLYLLAITGIKLLGAITPIGGLLLLCGWLGLFLGSYRHYKK